ncbi:MAG: hypothetical protein M3Z32_12840 [Acidobacteriota bacterium]|nr:hypothetical protein [Acidobacteriota bacterium]
MHRFGTILLILLTAGAWAYAETLKPADVKVFGALDYGDTSETVEYTGNPTYGAFLFNGSGKDRIEITVTSADRQAFVGIADGSLKQLASGTAKLVFTLPDHGVDAEAYYILFREAEGKPARFTVSVKKLQTSTAAASLR